MRIISYLAAAAVAAATVGSPAPAQSSGAMVRGPTHSGPSRGVGSPSWRGHPDFRHGNWRHRGRDRLGRDDRTFVYPYGFADYGDRVDPHGNGFFAGSGGEIRMRGGRPYYDYDRSYPYEFASGGSSARAEEREPSGSGSRCSVERGVQVCRGRR